MAGPRGRLRMSSSRSRYSARRRPAAVVEGAFRGAVPAVARLLRAESMVDDRRRSQSVPSLVFDLDRLIGILRERSSSSACGPRRRGRHEFPAAPRALVDVTDGPRRRRRRSGGSSRRLKDRWHLRSGVPDPSSGRASPATTPERAAFVLQHPWLVRRCHARQRLTSASARVRSRGRGERVAEHSAEARAALMRRGLRMLEKRCEAAARCPAMLDRLRLYRPEEPVFPTNAGGRCPGLRPGLIALRQGRRAEAAGGLPALFGPGHEC